MAGLRVLLFFAFYFEFYFFIFGPIEFECRARDSNRYELNTVHRKSQHIHMDMDMDHGRHGTSREDTVWARNAKHNGRAPTRAPAHTER